jgi:AcrR family transcriptional regulator
MKSQTANIDAILDVAKERFKHFGFKKTSMDEICNDARISKKTIYRHFKSKEELFTVLFIREAMAAREAILRQLGPIPDPRKKLETLLMLGIRYVNEESFMSTVVKDDRGLYLPFFNREQVILAEKSLLELIIDILREGIERGNFRRVDTTIAAYSILKLFQTFTYARTIPPHQKGESYETKALLDLIIRGIQK